LNLGIEVEPIIFSNYEKEGITENHMKFLLQTKGNYDLVKFIINKESNIGNINQFIQRYELLNENKKILLIGWAGERRYDLDLGFSRFTAINNNLFMDGDNIIPLTVEALQ